MCRRVMPLLDAAETRAELEDTNRSLLRLGDFPILDRDRYEERRVTLLKWRGWLEAQLADLEAEASR